MSEPTHDQLLDLTKKMADLSVLEFTLGTFTVKFDPLERARKHTEAAPDFDKLIDDLDGDQAKQRAKRAKQKQDEDLFWST